jgi:hypothetical protein
MRVNKALLILLVTLLTLSVFSLVVTVQVAADLGAGTLKNQTIDSARAAESEEESAAP